MRAWVAAVAVLLAAVLALGLRTPVTRPSPTAALGPESGQDVTDYLAVAEASRTGDGVRWALVSLDPPLDPPGLARLLARPLRLSQVLLHVPLERVQTPLLTRDLADQGPRVDELRTAWTGAAGTPAVSSVGRAARVEAYSARQLAAQCACAAGVLVRADAAQLDALALMAGVRAVQSAPADVGFGGLSVRPLLPEQVDVAGPGPDDGPLPTG